MLAQSCASLHTIAKRVTFCSRSVSADSLSEQISSALCSMHGLASDVGGGQSVKDSTQGTPRILYLSLHECACSSLLGNSVRQELRVGGAGTGAAQPLHPT